MNNRYLGGSYSLPVRPDRRIAKGLPAQTLWRCKKMAKFKMQVAADITSLVLLLNKLDYNPGPIKAATISSEGRIDVWFISGGRPGVKRVTAFLTRGEKTTHMDSPRRVYQNIVIRYEGGLKGTVEDQDFIDYGLETPRDYGFYPEPSDCSDCA